MALRAVGFERDIFMTIVAVGHAVLRLQLGMAGWTGDRHVNSLSLLPGRRGRPGRSIIPPQWQVSSGHFPACDEPAQ